MQVEGPSDGGWSETMQLSSPVRRSDPPHMLMSPPPEEVLRSARGKHASEMSSPLKTPRAGKRKRVMPTVNSGHSDNIFDAPAASSSSMVMDMTPNPKARKHPKKYVAFTSDATPVKSSPKSRPSALPTTRGLAQSPHASNPKINYLPPSSPSPARRNRHSVTPMPMYVPPTDRFTPPREILYTPVPTISKSSKRKSMGGTSVRKSLTKKGKGKLVIQIKKEPPEIDLNEPMPPASPSDDPLLLHGPPRSRRKPRRRSDHLYARDTPPMSSSPIKAPSGNGAHTDFTSLNFDTEDDDDGPLPAIFNFDFADGEGEHWSDDDEPRKDFDHTGDYTGKYKMMLVPTKVDPPSSSTRARQDAWGHPTSPYPSHNARQPFSPVPESPEAVDPDSPSANRTGVNYGGEPESPTRRLSLRPSQTLIPSTPAGTIDNDPSEDVLPPSSPPPEDPLDDMPEQHDWRESLTIPSDDHQVHSASAIPVYIDPGSDMHITEDEAEDAPGPPDTPYTLHALSTPATASTWSSAYRAARSSSQDAMEIVPLPSQVDNGETAMEVDAPADKPPIKKHAKAEELHVRFQEPEEEQEFEGIPAPGREYPQTPRPAVVSESPLPELPSSDLADLDTPVGPRRFEDRDTLSFSAVIPSTEQLVENAESEALDGADTEEPFFEELEGEPIDSHVVELEEPIQSEHGDAATSELGEPVEDEHGEPVIGESEDPATDEPENCEEDVSHTADDYLGTVQEEETSVDHHPLEYTIESSQQVSPLHEANDPSAFADAEPHSPQHNPTSTEALAVENGLSPEELEEIEDAESVVRELSHEPDFQDNDNEHDDEHHDDNHDHDPQLSDATEHPETDAPEYEQDHAAGGEVTDDDEDEGTIRLPHSRSMSQLVPVASPHNPFHVPTPHQLRERVGAAYQSTHAAEPSSPSPRAVVREGAPKEMPVPLQRGPPRPWPPTPAPVCATPLSFVSKSAQGSSPALASGSTTNLVSASGLGNVSNPVSVQMVTPQLRVAVDGDGGEDDMDYLEEDPSIIKIVSADPRAAARAAAILKMHKYETLERSSMPSAKRPSSRPHDTDSLLKSVFKNSRRKSLSQFGVQKSVSPKRRHTLGGVIGDKVIIPGSPVTTLPALLKEAETSLRIEEQVFHSTPLPSMSTAAIMRFDTPARTPAPLRTPKSVIVARPVTDGPREWSKADWKLMDSCFTDERVLRGGSSGLAPVDEIDLEYVVDRFLFVLGGEKILGQLGPSWTRDSLLKRARALRRKQSAGNYAPPLSTPSLLPHDTRTPSQQYDSLMSPASSSFGGISTSRPSVLSSVSNPPSPLSQAPVRYAQLLEEARSNMNINDEVSASIAEDAAVLDTTQSRSTDADHNVGGNSSTSSSGSALEEPSTPSNTSQDFEEANRSHITPLLPGPSSLSFAGKMKSLVFSYLPRFSRGGTEQAPPPQEPEPPKGLPFPPPEIFQKPRPPIKTPLPKVPPKPPHPKDLVRLHPPASKPSMIPRPTQTQSQGQNSRRLVELHPVPLKASTSSGTHPVGIPRSRRDSTASVKDLVKSFESMEKLQAAERESFRHLDLKRKRSIHEWTKAKAGNPKPSWRP